jgi:hypothetical protein
MPLSFEVFDSVAATRVFPGCVWKDRIKARKDEGESGSRGELKGKKFVKRGEMMVVLIVLLDFIIN